MYFPTIDTIPYQGPDSLNPLAFRHYDPAHQVQGKPLADHFKFACAYWHSLGTTGADPFGAQTIVFPWNTAVDPVSRAKHKMDAAFEFMQKLGLRYYCFHDVDVVEEGATLAETEQRLMTLADHALEHMAATGIKVLWGTANLFSHPRYMNGAATNPDMAVVAHAAAQVKIALDVTMKLHGENYVFWGGREGYMSLLNTDMRREQEHLATFLAMARDYARGQGFKGTFFIEPKPCEPSKHQYDYDCATVVGFIRAHDLAQDFKINVEVNHATLAGHSFEHELQVAADAGMLGSVDANRGDNQNGWDTDQFPVDTFELIQAMLVLLRSGGLQGGGVNFDAKLRRNSTDLEDLFYAHIKGMDAFAKAMIAADQLMQTSPVEAMRAKRYASFDHGIGADFEAGKLSLDALAEHAARQAAPTPKSGQQELYELYVSRFA